MTILEIEKLEIPFQDTCLHRFQPKLYSLFSGLFEFLGKELITNKITLIYETVIR